ncbi:MAG: NAD+ synthase [Proteobacteria bacterium]|nr:NAD+ synthase [Pseudomonadota bacterium]MBU1686012.1 NAD+ synthase [Pseudomonadota bacterium]
MKIALVQINPFIGDFTGNCERIRSWAKNAAHQGCDLVIFPELAISGYPPQDLLERPSFIEDQEKALHSLINQIKGIGVIVGAITRHTTNPGKALHNSAIVFEDGQVLASCHKRLLPSYDVFDESRYFEPGGPGKPLHYKGLTLLITICEDIWNDKDISDRQLYPVDPVIELLEPLNGTADLLINLSASPYRLGKQVIKNRIFTTISRKYSLPILYINQVGGQDSLLFDGRSLAVDRQGGLVHMAAAFQEDLLMIDTETLTGTKRLPEHFAPTDEIDDIFQALVMGTRDYVTKCGFQTGVIGLSGGIDSALTAAIACEALGPSNITGIALPSPYSSEESLDDARQLALNLGIRFEVIPIDELFQLFRQTLHPMLGDLHNNLTDQNIQARIRGNLLMAVSNRLGCMLLTTGNKSEMAVGYCTLYGDMSGGLAVISDVPKQMVYALAHHVNHGQIIIPERTIQKPPSAELAPGQIDQDDLPPYEILDQILKAWLEENRSINEIIAMGFQPETVHDVIRRIKINEYKRKQAPMGLKVTSKAFGYGRRYPTAENYRENA